MAAYYNEINPYAAQHLRNLITAGHIAAGDVDERDIRDVRPDDLRGYTQCHFFAGIGGWSLALRLAGWPDDRPVWTGSCPCQPFSQAGCGLGFADERHLWPFFHWLIAQCRPAEVTGEQVASKNVDDWIDLVQVDMEGLGYAFGSVPFPSAGVGAPHIRDRNFWLAHANNTRSQGRRRVSQRASERAFGSSGVAGIVADSDIGARRQGYSLDGGRNSGGDEVARAGSRGNGMSRELADTNRERLERIDPLLLRDEGGRLEGNLIEAAGRGPARGLADVDGGLASTERPQCGGEQRFLEEGARIERIEPADPTNGFWRAADWLLCRDEKWRPVEPGTFPLVDGLPAGMGKLSTGLRRLVEMAGLDAASLKRAKAYRVGSLRGYGNAINPHQAAEFIRAAEEALTA